MTSTIGEAEILKQDVRGRVRVPAERREALLDEFEKSALSGAKFALLVGIKYPTFANWVMRRRRQRAGAPRVAGGGEGTRTGRGPVRLFEAVVEAARGDTSSGAAADGLRIELPGGSRMVIGSPLQLQMAAELVALVAQRVGARC
jgi:hypothetical protein